MGIRGKAADGMEPMQKDGVDSAEIETPDDGPDCVRGLWEALAYLETEALKVGGQEVSVLIGCARQSLERRWGGYPPPEPGRSSSFH
ncbi:hypothetical protein [Rhodospirillum sp. A1_3_36]|uniref:hypothetical protein n=1 Tax=Rhodospirillum sp. A1_3_36 TaxID=3391666 RepID=UPI0039A7595F